MTDDARHKLQEIIDYCAERLAEAGRAPGQPAYVKDGRTRAYDDVLRYVRRRLDEMKG